LSLAIGSCNYNFSHLTNVPILKHICYTQLTSLYKCNRRKYTIWDISEFSGQQLVLP